MSPLIQSQRSLLAPGWVGYPSELWRRAKTRPSLDLRLAETKSLTDAVTGQSLISFTRASSGTFVGSDGLLKTATTNLLLRSEEFNDASWTLGQTSVSANVIESPAGSLTADKLIENTNSSTHLIQQIIAHTSGVIYTASCFVKAAERTFFSLTFGSGFTGTQANSFFDLSNVTTPTPGAAIVSLGNGWFRCSFTITATASASSAVQFRLATSTSVANYTGDGTSGIYLWGAQLEQSATVGGYVPTTSTINSAPRFDHNPTTGESLGLLVEEQRTNLLLYSEDLSAAASWTVTSATVTPNNATAPNDSLTADTVTATGTALIFQSITKTATATTYTGSLFVKGTVTALSISIDDGATTNRGRVIFNLSTGTVSSTINEGTFTSTSGTITLFPNGWYRLTVTTTTNSATAVRLRPFWTGAGTSLDFWGAQLEAGSFPTSYIPTTAAAATRSADVASITGANFSSFYNQTEGAFFVDSIQANITPSSRLVSASDNTLSNRIALGRGSGSSGNINLTVTNAGSVQVSALLLGTTVAAGTSNKVAAVYKAADFAGSVNGLPPVTQGTGTVPNTLTQLSIGNGEALGANPMTGTIRRLAYWPVRLGNNVLQQITQ